MSFDCRFCGETGLVSVYHPEDVVFVRRNRRAALDSGYPRRALAAVPCKCPCGDRYANPRMVRGQLQEPTRFGQRWYHIRPRWLADREKLMYDVASDVLDACRDMAEDNPFNAALQDSF